MKLTKQLEVIQKIYLNDEITQFALDARNYGKTAIDWCNLYLEVLDYDRKESISEIVGTKAFPKFYIKDLERAIEDVVPKNIANALKKFFGLDGGRRIYLTIIRDNDIALQNMVKKARIGEKYLKSFKALYIYHNRIHNIMDSISKKVKDYDKYTVLECVKYAHVYYRYIKDFQFMPYDSKVENSLSKEEFVKEIKKVPIQEVRILEEEWEIFFKKIPDEDIIIPQIKKFLWEADEEIENVISHDAQLKEDVFFSITYGAIRAVKEKYFNCGEWNMDYFRVTTIMERLTINCQ